MIIMFIISASTGVGAVASLMFTSFYLVDMSSRLRLDRIQKRDKTNAWNHRLLRKIATVRLRSDRSLHCVCMRFICEAALPLISGTRSVCISVYLFPYIVFDCIATSGPRSCSSHTFMLLGACLQENGCSSDTGCDCAGVCTSHCQHAGVWEVAAKPVLRLLCAQEERRQRS